MTFAGGNEADMGMSGVPKCLVPNINIRISINKNMKSYLRATTINDLSIVGWIFGLRCRYKFRPSSADG